MFQSIKAFFEDKIDHTDTTTGVHATRELRLATAALLIEVARADHDTHADELDRIVVLIKQHFDLNAHDTQELLHLAEKEVHKMTSYFHFSSLINKKFSYQEKVKLIENMWHIALIDNSLDKYEEHFIRKIANLIYIKRQDIVIAKQRAIKSVNLHS